MRIPNLLFILFMLSVLTGVPPIVNSEDQQPTHIIFEGKVLQIGPRMPASGYFVFHRLAKYQVENICRGNLEEKEIVVDHLSLYTGEELEGVKVGDVVCVAVEVRNEKPRTFVRGIREAADQPAKIYFGGEVVLAKGDSCSRQEEAMYYLHERSRKAK